MMSNDEVKAMIADLRGGIPPKCEFCGEVRPENEMHPEEAGEWACIHCIRRWHKEDGEHL